MTADPDGLGHILDGGDNSGSPDYMSPSDGGREDQRDMDPRGQRDRPKQNEFWIKTLHDVADEVGVNRDGVANIYNEVIERGKKYAMDDPSYRTLRKVPLGDVANDAVHKENFESRLRSALIDYAAEDDAETVVDRHGLHTPPLRTEGILDDSAYSNTET